MSRSTRHGRKRTEPATTGPDLDEAAGLPEALSSKFTGELATYRDALVVSDTDRPSLPGASLLRSEGFDDVLEPFVARYPGADRRAVVSLWSQWYFSALVVPSVAANLLLDRDLPLGIEGVDLLLDEDDHRPSGFRLPHEGGALEPDAGPFTRFGTLVRGHLEPLVDALARHGGLATRLLWSNAGAYFDWVVRRLEPGDDEDGVEGPGRRLLRARSWPDGRPNPLCEPLREVDGAEVRQRRICCLRYLVPGVARCEGRCPLPR